MTSYMRERGFETYAELQRWSVEDLEGFWGSIWDRFEVGERGSEVLSSREMPGATWFPGTLVNYAEQAFRGRSDDALAIIAGGEDREDVEWTWGELRAQTARIAAGLRAQGVERGDRVVAYMPNIPETAAAFLACASIGAVWSSCSPDFGARSVIDRFEQIEPKVLLAVRGYRYNGREFDRAEALDAIVDAMPGLRLHGGPGRGELDVADRGRSRARVRPRAVRPPAVGPVLLGHDRPAEGDRAVAGRDPARAPEDAAPARRRAGRRPALLVHDDRLDDVELHRLRAADRRDDPALRRLPRLPGHGRAVGLRGAHADDHVRHERELHRRVHEGGRRAGQGTRPVGAEGGRLDRLAALPRGLPLGLRARRARTPGCSRPAAAPTSARRSSAARRWSRSTRASCRRARSAPRSSPGTRTASRTSARSASSC